MIAALVSSRRRKLSDGALFRERAVSGVIIDLENARKRGQMRDRLFGSLAGAVVTIDAIACNAKVARAVLDILDRSNP
jgi:hypothetical protein